MLLRLFLARARLFGGRLCCSFTAGLLFMALVGCNGEDAPRAPSPVATSTPEAPAPSPSSSVSSSNPPVLGLPNAPNDPVILGVQTHFSQGWPVSNLAHAAEVKAPLLRDSFPWGSGETGAGSYDFTSSRMAALRSACGAGHKLILTQEPKHSSYDQGAMTHSAVGQLAFAKYVRALLDELGDCVAAIEVGNEVNTSDNMGYAPSVDATAAYIEQLKVLRRELGGWSGKVSILGGSANMIATGFLEALFAADMLPLVDGIAVHPYSRHGDSMAIELANLTAVMKKYDNPVPVWVTEFSHDIKAHHDAASRLVKTVTLLGYAGAKVVSWYALIDQQWFPNMGLFSGGERKPQGNAFLFLQDELLSHGRPVRLQTNDPSFFAYRYGSNRWVVWGTPRNIELSSSAQAYSPQGTKIADTRSLRITEEPVVILGPTSLEPGKSEVLVDSLLQWGQPELAYYARTADGKLHELDLFDGHFESQMGSRWFKPLRIGPLSAAPAGTGSDPTKAVWRYTASQAQSLFFSGCFAKNLNGDGVDLTIKHNNTVLASTILTEGEVRLEASPRVKAGDVIEVIAGPNQTFGGDAFDYRFLISQQTSSVAARCP